MALKILICEDEKISHGWLVKMIKSWGHNTISAYSGAESIKLANEHVPDVILLDMLFPDMEGIEVLKKFRENSDLDGTRVITASATATEDLIEKTKDLNVWTSLPKPIKKADLKKLLDELENSTDSHESEQLSFMVVTKNGIHQKALEKLFGELGCRILTAENPEEAEPLLKSVKVNGILLDLDSEGAEIGGIIKQVRGITSEYMPIILEIISVDQDTLMELSALHVTDILVKPVSLNRLKSMIEGVLARLKAAHEKKSGSGPKTILIVEDFSITANMLSRLFAKTDFETLVARTGPQAFEMIAKHKPDLMLLDLNLPGMNGIELLEMLEKESMKPAFAVSTAEKDQTKLRLLTKMGALKIFHKPIVGEDLLYFIRSFNFQTGTLDNSRCEYQVLFASEDNSTIQAVEQALNTAGLSFKLTADSGQIQSEIKGRPPALVIDTDLKGVEYKELIRKIRSSKQNEAMKILSLSMKMDQAMQQELEGLGVNTALTKPLSITELTKQLKNLLADVQPAVDLSEFTSQFLNELGLLPRPHEASYFEQAKRLGHNLAGTAGLVSSTDLHDVGRKLEDAAEKGDAAACQTHVESIRKLMEKMAAKAAITSK